MIGENKLKTSYVDSCTIATWIDKSSRFSPKSLSRSTSLPLLTKRASFTKNESVSLLVKPIPSPIDQKIIQLAETAVRYDRLDNSYYKAFKKILPALEKINLNKNYRIKDKGQTKQVEMRYLIQSIFFKLNTEKLKNLLSKPQCRKFAIDALNHRIAQLSSQSLISNDLTKLEQANALHDCLLKTTKFSIKLGELKQWYTLEQTQKIFKHPLNPYWLVQFEEWKKILFDIYEFQVIFPIKFRNSNYTFEDFYEIFNNYKEENGFENYLAVQALNHDFYSKKFDQLLNVNQLQQLLEITSLASTLCPLEVKGHSFNLQEIKHILSNQTIEGAYKHYLVAQALNQLPEIKIFLENKIF